MAQGDRVNWRTGVIIEVSRAQQGLWQCLLLLIALGVAITRTMAAEAEADFRPVPLADFRNVPYESLLHNMDQFTETGVTHFSEILFDVKRYQLIVGARDALFRLSLDGLTKLEMTEWPATATTIGLCTAKGQSEDFCRNFIKVLVQHEDQIFTCGTHAFSPKCSWREIQDIAKVTKWIDGKARCPYSPLDNSTAFMSAAGDYYIGSATDFSSNDHAIYRMSGHNVDQAALRTVQYNSVWLAQPDFVGSFETDDYVYFMFREAAVEFMNCGKAVYSRIARVCKADRGGSLVLKDNWTTFLKARLNCSLPGDYPFYYNEIQSVFYLAEERLVYATFTTAENSIAGAAVCSFNLSAVEAAFAGPFKHQARPDATWGPANGAHDHFQCGREPDSDALLASRQYQLMDQSVQSTHARPLYTENLNRFYQVVVDVVATKHQDSPPVHIIFVATETGTIRKLSYNPRSGETCLVEILHPFPKSRAAPLRNLKLLTKTASLYIAAEESLVKLPVQRCARFLTKKDCLNAMDPYCGWNRNKEECTTAPNRNPRVATWQQHVLACPVLTDPVDGGWSAWSTWDQCAFSNPDRRVESGGDYCMCRRRACDSPPPANGGAGCEGPGLVVTNCTQHGQWTHWSEWSGCSQTCGVGLKTRQRYCGNPEPAFGGRVCVGRDREEQYCDDLPPCPGQMASSLVDQRAEAPSWSEWSDWTACSARCGSGFKSRGRRCYGVGCTGCDREWAECENPACADYTDVTDWTPWINTTKEASGWYEKRFTFNYRAPVSISKVGRIGEERRYCYGPDRCTIIGGKTTEASPEDFTDWSACSRPCGGGVKFKVRVCVPEQQDCTGHTLVEQECNTQPCPGSWGCWSNWGRCSGSRRSRSRACLADHDSSDTTLAVDCGEGEGREEEACRDDDSSSALAPNRQNAALRPRDGSAEPVAAATAGMVPLNMVVGACVAGFMIGGLLGAVLTFYYLKNRKPGGGVGCGGGGGGGVGSPHYISNKSQNLYVSLPMLDLKHKQLSSSAASDYSGTLRSNATGTLRSSKAGGGGGSSLYGGSSNKPADYETATIKRSHSRRDSSLLSGGGIRADLDSDNLFT